MIKAKIIVKLKNTILDPQGKTIQHALETLGSFIVSDLLGGAKSILVGNLIQNQFIVARDKPFGSAIAFVLSSFVLVLLYIYRKFWGGKIEVL